MSRKKREVSEKSIKRAIALFFALLSMFTLLSPLTVHLNLFGAGFFYLGGLIFMWGLIPLFAFFCLFIFQKGHFPPYLWRYIVGFILLSLGISALISFFSFNGAAPFSFSSYNEIFAAISSPALMYLSSSLGGGLIGFILYSAFSFFGVPFLYLFSVVLLLAGLIVIFFPLLKRLRQRIKTRLAIIRSKKASEKERKRIEEEEERKRRRIEAIAPLDEDEPLPSSKPNLEKEDDFCADNEKKTKETTSFEETRVNSSPLFENAACEEESAASSVEEEPPHIEKEEKIEERRIDIYHRQDIDVPPFAGAVEYVSAPLSSLIDPEPKEAMYVPEAALLGKAEDDGIPSYPSAPLVSEEAPLQEEKIEMGAPFFVPSSLNDSEKRKESHRPIDNDKEFAKEAKEEAKIAEPEKIEAAERETIVIPPPLGYEEPIEEQEPQPPFPELEKESAIVETVEEAESAPMMKKDEAFVEDTSEQTNNPMDEEKEIIDESAPTQEETAKKEEAKIDPTVDPLTGERYAPPLSSYAYPDESLLNEIGADEVYVKQEQDCNLKKEIINATLESFKAGAHVESYTIGPSVTRFNIATDSGITVSSVKRYIQSIQVKLGGIPTRYEEVVIGQMTSGLEIVNEEARTVYMKEIFRALPPLNPKTRLYIPFGEDISGKFVSGDLSKFPHMLVSGGTGSGKSVYMHSVIMSLIMRNRPEELKLVMIDPKRVEMGCYSNIPHLLCPIVKEMSQAKVCVDKLCHEMERRYSLFEKTGTREINEYNNSYAAEHNLTRLPFIVCIIDEFADLMDTFKNVEDPVVRIAQKARAAGIHLIIATQRPTVNVVTGRLKANLGVRVALSMNSSTDSVTILNQAGAEELAGHGDMLVICPEVLRNGLIRAQGAMVETSEIKRVCDFVKSESLPQYDPYFLDLVEKEEEVAPLNVPLTPMDRSEIRKAASDDLYEIVKEKTMSQEYMSISRIQREFEVGFSRAGKLFKRLQEDGIVEMSGGPTNSKGSRVLIHSESKETSLPAGSTDNSDLNGSSSR